MAVSTDPIKTGVANSGTQTAANSLSVTPASDAVFVEKPLPVTTQDVTFASTESLTPIFALPDGYEIVGIQSPASIGTTTVLTFQSCPTASATAGDYSNLYDVFGQELRLNNMRAAALRDTTIPELHGKRYLRLRRGTADVPNIEAVAHTYKLVLAAA